MFLCISHTLCNHLEIKNSNPTVKNKQKYNYIVKTFFCSFFLSVKMIYLDGKISITSKLGAGLNFTLKKKIQVMRSIFYL